MSVAARDYGSAYAKTPRSWTRIRQQPSAYRECLHPPIVIERDAVSLSDLLKDLVSESFLDRMVGMRAGREELGLRADALVQRIVRKLTVSAETRTAVEEFMDRVFADIRPKHVFLHTESVMALFFAMKEAKVDYLREILTPFADSKATEVAVLSNFAKSLLT